MLTYMFISHTDGTPHDRAPWVSDDIIDTWDHVREVLAGVLGEADSINGESFRDILKAVGALLRISSDEVERSGGVCYTYAEPADPHGATVAWGFTISVLP